MSSILEHTVPTAFELDHVLLKFAIAGHFIVVGLVSWPLNESEAGIDLVFIETSLFLLC